MAKGERCREKEGGLSDSTDRLRSAQSLDAHLVRERQKQKSQSEREREGGEERGTSEYLSHTCGWCMRSCSVQRI